MRSLGDSGLIGQRTTDSQDNPNSADYQGASGTEPLSDQGISPPSTAPNGPDVPLYNMVFRNVLEYWKAKRLFIFVGAMDNHLTGSIPSKRSK